METGPEKIQSLFRKEALDHLLREEDLREPLRVSPPWTWSLIWAMGLFIFAVLVGSFLGKVEVRAAGRGILQPLAGVRQLALLRSEGRGFNAREEVPIQDQIKFMRGKITSQQILIASYQRSMEFQEKSISNIQRLIEEKLEPRFKLEEACDQMNSVRRQHGTAKQRLNQLQLELAALESTRQRKSRQHSQELNGAQGIPDAPESSLRQSKFIAPPDRSLEALVAQPGDVIQLGQSVAKVIPECSPLQVVAFLAEKDRHEVNPSTIVNLELNSYPSSEYGTLRGRVLRIGSDLASPFEVQDVLGVEARLDAPSYRVDIEILQDRPKRLWNVALHPGMQCQVRFILRRQRLITLVLDPLRQWLE